MARTAVALLIISLLLTGCGGGGIGVAPGVRDISRTESLSRQGEPSDRSAVGHSVESDAPPSPPDDEPLDTPPSPPSFD